MLHIIMTLLIYGTNTESVKCPEMCHCVEIFPSGNMSVTSTMNFDLMNNGGTGFGRHLNAFTAIMNRSNMNRTNHESEVDDENKTIPRNQTQVKKCAKNANENLRDIFIHNFSMKSVKPLVGNYSKEVRKKRTLIVNHVANGRRVDGTVNGIEKSVVEKESPLTKETVEEDLKTFRNKGIPTYQVTCNGLRESKPVWFQYLPNTTTELNIRQAYFQSFKTFQEILKESPTKLNHLTVLSVSDSVINHRADKKYSARVKSVSSEEKWTNEENEDESKRSEFLPFASLQNPKPRSKADLEFISKGKYKNLQVLNLPNNTLTYLPPDTFYPFQNLQILNLSDNLIKFMDSEIFSSLINLVQLDIHNNRLESVNEILFKNLTKLLFLDVSQNLISNIAPSTFQYLISLNVLNLASNPLSEKQEAMILLGTGKRLQMVDISNTGLKQIPGTLERSVRILNLVGNHLLSVRCGDLDSYSLLSYLNLRGNKISYVEDDALGRLEFLSNLQISENNLFQIPKSLPNNLEILNLSYNNIQNITNLDFLNLSLLKELYLSYNQVSNIEGNAFNNLAHLKVLDLSRNPILILPNIYSLVKLTVLNLSYFTNIPGSFSIKYKQFPVQSPGSIKHLNLESSPVLTKVLLQDTKTLESFTDLEELNVRFTNLTTIRRDIFSLLPKLKVLKVEGNPWHCGKDILVLSAWLKDHENIQMNTDEDEINTAHCSSPLRLYRTILITLSEKDFKDADNESNTILDSVRAFDGKTETNNSSKRVVDSNEDLKDPSNLSERWNQSEKVQKVRKVIVENNNRNSVNIKPTLNSNKMDASKEKIPSEKLDGNLERHNSQENMVSHFPASESTPSEKKSHLMNITASGNHDFVGWANISTDFYAEMKNSIDTEATQMSMGVLKKAEAVTSKDTHSLNKEYNSHLSFFILSSIGLVMMVTLILTSLYYSRKRRRDQSYQRQNQDIEVCSISSLGNELW